jgi:hypothetical protein
MGKGAVGRISEIHGEPPWATASNPAESDPIQPDQSEKNVEGYLTFVGQEAGVWLNG